MNRIFTILLFFIFSFSISLAQHDQQFLQEIANFDHRLKHPTEEDLGFKVTDMDLLFSDHLLDDYYLKIIKEKKEYIKSQIGKVSTELLFEHMLYARYSEDEIYEVHTQFDEEDFESPMGRQIKDIIDYVKKKKEIVGEEFPNINMVDADSITYTFPFLTSDRYILLHFWSAVCESCKEKNQYFSDNHTAYNRAGVIVISICVDFFPDVWKKLLIENNYKNPNYYIPREKFMELSEEYILELSSTLLIGTDHKIISRDIFRLDELNEKIIFGNN